MLKIKKINNFLITNYNVYTKTYFKLKLLKNNAKTNKN